MNCRQARFLLYAYLDREMTRTEEQALSRHVAGCAPCALRARSARGLAGLLRSRLNRRSVPDRLRLRIHHGTHTAAPTRAAVGGLAAAVLLLIVPIVADGVPERSVESRPAANRDVALVSKHMTGKLVCLDCETRRESGLCDVHPAGAVHHETAFCADDGEVWRLLPPPSGYSNASFGQTMTVEGVAFPQSGFLRASRAGY
jgi:hypothetical protein